MASPWAATALGEAATGAFATGGFAGSGEHAASAMPEEARIVRRRGVIGFESFDGLDALKRTPVRACEPEDHRRGNPAAIFRSVCRSARHACCSGLWQQGEG